MHFRLFDQCFIQAIQNKYIVIDMWRLNVPPVMVNVANSYSATLKPALLCAVILKTYQVAGSKSKKISCFTISS